MGCKDPWREVLQLPRAAPHLDLGHTEHSCPSSPARLILAFTVNLPSSDTHNVAPRTCKQPSILCFLIHLK